MDLEELVLTESDFPLCLFSDAHGDAEMLRHLFAKERERCRTFFSVGDLVDYRRACEDNESAVQFAIEQGLLGVRGNHDDWVLGASKALSEVAQDYFWAMPDALVLKSPFGHVGLFHSVPESNVVFADEGTMEAHLPVFKQLDLRHVFVGHTHQSYTFERNGVQVVNLGHLGREVVGDADTGYAVLHLDGEVEKVIFIN